MDQYIYINGSLQPRKDAKVSVLDHSFLYGLGAFETLKAKQGVVLFIDEHINRLFRSAKNILINHSYDRNLISNAIYSTLKKNSLTDAYIRITLSRGEGEPGFAPSNKLKPNLVIYTKPPNLIPTKWFIEGVSIEIVSILKQASGVIGVPLKCCNYIHNFLAKQEATLKGAIEGIMLSNEGYVTEGATSNIFIVKNETVLTPKYSEYVLDGVTRNRVIDLANKNGYKVLHDPIKGPDLLSSDECFITNTSLGVLPVTQIGDQKVGDGKPGIITRELSMLYEEDLELIVSKYNAKIKCHC